MNAVGQPAPQQDISPANVAIAEMKGMADVFARMTKACYTKCIPNVKESALSTGEMSCVDRCVSKYLDVHALVGGQLNSSMQQ